MRISLCILSLQLLIFCNRYRSSSATALKGWDVQVVDGADDRYSFIVAIQRKSDKKIKCAGSLISNRHVLTSVDCITPDEDPTKTLEVVAGNNKRRFGTAYQIAQHKSYSQWAQENNVEPGQRAPRDIEIFTLASEVSGNVRIARLTFKPARDFDNQAAHIFGWGATDYELQSDALRKGSVKLVDPAECRLLIDATHGHVPDNRLRDDRFCSFASQGKYDRLSHGDEGGPLVVANELIGIATHPIIPDGDHKKEEPNIHLNIYSYKAFIESFIASNGNVGAEEDEACEYLPGDNNEL